MTGKIEENPIIPQLREAMLDAAKAEGVNLADDEVIEKYKQLRAMGIAYEAARTDSDKKRILGQITDFGKDLGQNQMLAISRLLGVDAVLINCVGNYEFSVKTQNPKERFKQMLSGILESPTADEDLERLAGIKDRLLLSIVHTMHPVIFHTPEARASERAETQRLEKMGPIEERYGGKLPPEEVESFRKWVELNLRKMAIGVTVTPFSKTTVSTENSMELQNMRAIMGYTAEVISAWNEAVTELSNGRDLSVLRIDDKKARELFEFRTWGRGADADGRHFSTSHELWRGIELGVDYDKAGNRVYNGPTLDLRQNAEIHQTLMGALIQVNFWQTGDFRNSTKAFMDGSGRTTTQGKTTGKKYNPNKNIYQELTEDDQVEFVRHMLARGDRLVPQALFDESLLFSQAYSDLFQEFLTKKKLPSNTSFQALNKDPDKNFAMQEEFRLMLEKEEGYRLDKEGLGFSSTSDVSSTGITFLSKTVKLSGSGGRFTHAEIADSEKSVLMGVMKRLIVINSAIDEFGAAVADRHQIANFSSQADFYNMLFLFEQTGIVELDRSGRELRVSKAKMDIQPLLETAEDLRNAKEMFDKVLQDPLARSYYATRDDRAQFMLGFSDGSKSAGNFSSQWEIYKATRELQKLFADHGIETRFFQGRGRGEDRGGTIEQGAAMRLMPAEVAKAAVYDATIQGDLPMNMANSPAYGKDVLASTLMGTMTAALKAEKQGTSKSEIDRKKSQEDAIDFIARLAEERYVEVVRQVKVPEKERQVEKFLDAMPINPERSSRARKRTATIKKGFDQLRAIDVEYGFNLPGLAAHDVGLAYGLNSFIESNMEVIDSTGKRVKGEDALKVLYKEHDFFRTQIDLRSVGISHQEPVISEMYGEMSGTTEYVKSIHGELRDLRGLLDTIKNGDRRGKETKRPSTILNVVAHGLIRAAGGKIPDQDMHPDLAKTIKNLSFVTAQHFSHPLVTPELQQSVSRAI